LPRVAFAAEPFGGALIAAADRRLRIGIQFPFSMHAELLYYWLGALGVAAPEALEIRTVPPPLIAKAIAEGEIDAFCVGEPWGSIAVERAAAEIVLPTCAIWRFAPEKVLAVRHDWIGQRPDVLAALMRALWGAARWLSDRDNRMTASEMLGRAEYVDVAPEIVERALTGRLVVAPRGELRKVPGMLQFFDGAATFPWRSQAVWIASRLAARTGVDRDAAAAAARRCFRPDLYRAILGPRGADLPGASEKLEGALQVPTAVASTRGEMMLGPDWFFDGRTFDPDAPA
jgi:NitT/TauT family transport system ATP-binding protein